MQKFCVATAYIIPKCCDSWILKITFSFKNSQSPIDFFETEIRSENLGRWA